MKRFIVFLTLVCMGAFASMALAGDYHTTTTLICSDCHNMHSSMTHSYGNTGGTPPQKDVVAYPWNGGTAGHEYLLFGDVNQTCLLCHNNSGNGPDVYGTNTGMYSGATRQAGGLNGLLTGVPAPGGSYTDNTGHTLGSMSDPPGKGSSAYVASTEGLECTNCHAQHGSTTQYRNLLNRGIFDYVAGVSSQKNVTYTVGAPVAQTGLTGKDVSEVANSGANHYVYTNINFYEPVPDSSRYANWCKTCHQDFHGRPGGTELGGTYGGYANSSTTPWRRHPTAGVNLNESPTFVSRLSVYAGKGNKVKMMDSQALWTGAAGVDSTLTPSCMTCHKAHGNENPFGLIYMSGNGTINDNGDTGANAWDGTTNTYKSLCKQCHVQGG